MERIRNFEEHIESITGLCLVYNSKLILSCSLDRKIILWNLENAKTIWKSEWHHSNYQMITHESAKIMFLVSYIGFSKLCF
jgi:WD40 repeat protein